jgi:hypothetical protein
MLWEALFFKQLALLARVSSQQLRFFLPTMNKLFSHSLRRSCALANSRFVASNRRFIGTETSTRDTFARADSILGELQSVELLHQMTALAEHDDPSCDVSATLRGIETSDGDSSSSDAKKPGVYVGIDPTAPSLHLGNLLQLCTLLRFKRLGFPTFALMGGATGLIGDPSGRSSERPLIEDRGVVTRNVDSISRLVRTIMSKSPSRNNEDITTINNNQIETQLVNNADWFAPMSTIDFLRDVGKHFPILSMLAKDSVRSRIESHQQKADVIDPAANATGITFTEFS